MTLLQALAIHAARLNDHGWLSMTYNRRIWVEAMRVIETTSETAEAEHFAQNEIPASRKR